MMNWHGLKERQPIIEAFEALEDIDWLRREIGRTGPTGRAAYRPLDGEPEGP